MRISGWRSRCRRRRRSREEEGEDEEEELLALLVVDELSEFYCSARNMLFAGAQCQDSESSRSYTSMRGKYLLHAAFFGNSFVVIRYRCFVLFSSSR